MAGMEEEEHCSIGESGEGRQRGDGSILNVGGERTHLEDRGSKGGRKGGRKWSGIRIV
jgi:hypothetical protein